MIAAKTQTGEQSWNAEVRLSLGSFFHEGLHIHLHLQRQGQNLALSCEKGGASLCWPLFTVVWQKKVTLTAAAKTKSNQCHRGLWRSNIRLLHVNGTVLWTLQSSTWPFTCYIFQKMDQRSSWHLPHEKQIMTKLCREKVAENTCDVSWYRWSSVTTLGGKQLSTFNQTHLRVNFQASANIWNNHLLLFCWLFYRIETIKSSCPIDFTFQRRIGRWISHLQKDFWLLCVRTRSLECSSGAAPGPSHLLLAPFITLPAMASVFTTI